MGALDGVRVVEWATWVAVPGAGTLLGDWGAEVIKVENHQTGGDAMRRFYLAGVSLKTEFNYTWEEEGRNKLSLTLDLSQQTGREIMYKLLESSDILLTNIRPSARKKLGMDYDTLSKINPKLILGHLTGYGTSGKEGWRPGYDFTAFWARGGVMSLLAEPGADPVTPRPGMGDRISSIILASAVMAALYNRERTGQGQETSVSLFNAAAWIALLNYGETLATGVVGCIPRKNRGNPLSIHYKAKDGWIQLSNPAWQPVWPRFCKAIGRPDLEKDKRFEAIEGRVQNSAELIGIFDEILKQRTRAEWGQIFDQYGIVWAPVQSIAEAITDPQAIANDHFVSIQHPTCGEQQLVATPAKFSRTPASIRRLAPELGQHTEEILLDLGYGWADIEKFKEEKVIL